GSACDGICRSRRRQPARATRRRARCAQQRQGKHRRLCDIGAQGFRRRRHATRAVARRVGDPRRPPVRACRRPVPDGLLAAATLMSSLVTLDVAEWRPALAPQAQRDAARALESGAVLVLPRLAFAMSAAERRFLSPDWSNGRAKNISLDRKSVV